MSRVKGSPKTGGRKPGSKNKRTLGKLKRDDDALSLVDELIRENKTPVQHLTDVMLDPAEPTDRRDRAAIALLPFVHPRLSQISARVQQISGGEKIDGEENRVWISAQLDKLNKAEEIEAEAAEHERKSGHQADTALRLRLENGAKPRENGAGAADLVSSAAKPATAAGTEWQCASAPSAAALHPSPPAIQHNDRHGLRGRRDGRTHCRRGRCHRAARAARRSAAALKAEVVGTPDIEVLAACRFLSPSLGL